MGEVKHLVVNGLSWGIEEINKLYQSGELRGIQFQAVLNDGSFITGNAGDLAYLERLGLLEAAKENIWLANDG